MEEGTSLQDMLWYNKYKPKTLDDLKIPSDYRRDFEYFIDNKNIPHLLLYGPPGGGKTTLAHILCSKNGIIHNPDDNVLEVRGSSQKTRGISSVQDIIEPFLQYPPSGDDNLRIVLIDEGDKLTPDALDSLRSTINDYSKYGRFIITCNYVSKLTDPIISRFEQGKYEFKQLPLEDVKSHCEHILNSEGIDYDEESLMKVINGFYPDIRKIVGRLQRHSYNGKLNISENDVKTLESNIVDKVIEFINLLLNGSDRREIGKCMKFISDSLENPDLDYAKMYEDLFFDKRIKNAAIKIKINQYANSHNYCVSPSMNFMAFVFSIREVVKDYYGNN